MSKREVGTVAWLGRYPVKSLRGETLPRLELSATGVIGDRALALYGRDGKIASGKSTRRFRRMDHLLSMRAWTEAGGIWVELPDGGSHPADEEGLDHLLSAVVGEEVELRPETSVRHVDDAAVHLLSSSALLWAAEAVAGFDAAPARFRPNVIIDTTGARGRTDEGWLGCRLRLGSCEIEVFQATERCVMITQAQGDLPSTPTAVRMLTALNQGCLGVYSRVVQPGTVSCGDPVLLIQ